MTNYLISYDLSDTKLRSQLAKKLLQAGCIRIQKSVFFAPNFSPLEIKSLKSKVKTIAQNGQSETDSILCISIDKQDFRKMIWIENKASLSQEVKNRYSKLF